MGNSFYRLLLPFLATIHIVLSQTYTDCNPTTNTSCPSDTALGKTITIDFTAGESSEFTAEIGTELTYGTNGAEFTITSAGLARTIVSNSYIFFGKVEVALRAAPGTGIVTSFVMESDDLDEIDWREWLGGNNTIVETNYFGKGNTTTYDSATYETVSDPQDAWHIYTIDWTSERIEWSVDGVLLRTLLYADAVDGKNYPQTPMNIRIGNWVGGAADEAVGTVSWAGGYTDLDDAPFTMYVKNLTIQDYSSCAASYTYGDQTGSFDSIVVAYNRTEEDGSCSSTESATATATATATSATATGGVFAASGSNSTASSTSASAAQSATGTSSAPSTAVTAGASMSLSTDGVAWMLFGIVAGYLYL